MEVTMYGDREREDRVSFLEWLTGWAVLIGFCFLFWLVVYRVVEALA